MNTPLVSVIMPVFNGQLWLREAIESALGQSWRPLELIVVDDGSSDASAQIATKYEGARVRILRQQNQGASVARNAGLAVARGDFLQYLDADDLLAPRKIELQIAALESRPERVATCSWARFVDSPEDAELLPSELWKDLGSVEFLVEAHARDRFMPNHAWLIPRVVAEKAGEWPPMRARNDDAEYFAKVVLASEGTRFVAEARAYYRSGHSGLSAARDRRAVEGYYWTLGQITQYLLKREDSARTRRAMATSYDLFARNVGPQHPDLASAAEEWVRQLAGQRFAPLGAQPLERIFTRVIGRPAFQLIRRNYRNLRRRKRAPSNSD